MHPSTPHDFLSTLALYDPFLVFPKGMVRPPKRIVTMEEASDRPRPKPFQLRESHLQAKKYWPFHPFLKIAKILPQRLPTMAELESMDHATLARRFLLTSRKFKCRPKTA